MNNSLQVYCVICARTEGIPDGNTLFASLFEHTILSVAIWPDQAEISVPRSGNWWKQSTHCDGRGFRLTCWGIWGCAVHMDYEKKKRKRKNNNKINTNCEKLNKISCVWSKKSFVLWVWVSDLGLHTPLKSNSSIPHLPIRIADNLRMI